MQWALGDWWAYGFHQYGKRKEIAQKIGLNFGTLMNYGFVARRVKTSCRNEVLSFTHHWVAARFKVIRTSKTVVGKGRKASMVGA